ncbi:MAG: hypothetical protein B6D41_22105 [Chloroflexi bacterium UTCFX4]|jgi:serine/threonine protein kinase|nr:MAG: hypothetical protein B6D41_22105 [Chloroflexi bacterium UTCFX4]
MEHYAGKLLAKRYQLTHKLGEGGMARVYLATDLDLNTQVAVKQNTLGTGAQDWQLFETEVQVLVKLRDTKPPSVPLIFDYKTEIDDGVPIQYLVMDYVPGQDLEELVKNHGPLEPARARQWLDQVMQALEILHAHPGKPILHRDIKPSNIRVHANSQTVYLVDFGIAGSSPLILISPSYSPPEQYRGFLSTDPRSDIYSLGSTFYTLVTGDALSAAPDRQAGSAALPTHVIFKKYPDLQTLITQATALDPAKRFQSVTEMRKALQKLALGNLPLLGIGQRVQAAAPIPLAPAPNVMPRRTTEWQSETSQYETLQVRTTPSGHLVTTHTSKQVRFWQVASWYQPATLYKVGLHDYWLGCLATTVSGPNFLAATGGHDWTVRVWDVPTGNLALSPLSEHHDKITALAFSPDGQRLISAGADAIIYVRDLDHSAAPTKLATNFTALAMAVSPNGESLIAADQNGALALWNLKTYQREKLPDTISRLGGKLYAIAYSPRGDRIALGGETGTLYLIDPQTWTPRFVKGKYPGVIHDLTFSPTGRFIAAGGNRACVEIWDSFQEQTIGRIEQLAGETWSVAFGASDKFLAIACRTGQVSLWQL